jgi:hypothetical protein
MRPAVVLLLFLSLAGCASVVVRNDIFAEATADCSVEVSAPEKLDLRGKVDGCLVGEDVAGCLDGLIPPYSLDSVACAVRDRGGEASAKAASGSANDGDRAIAQSAKDWIRAERIGYRQ